MATRELDTQALEQILIGHMMAIAGEANQIFRPVTMFDHGIDGEVEFKDNDGKASGKKIYVQLKSGNSYLRTREGDGSEVFDVRDEFGPWNAGRWRLEGGHAERTEAEADLALDVTALGSAYLGGFSFTQLADAGRVEERTDGALGRADEMFRWHRAPWCPEIF